MTIDTRPTTAYPCPSVAYLVVDGREVGLLRCTLEAGHNDGPFPKVLERPVWHPASDEAPELGYWSGMTRVQLEATPHQHTLKWDDPEGLIDSWPEYDDPDEGFDLEVDIAPAEVVKSAERTADLNNGGLGLVTSIDDE